MSDGDLDKEENFTVITKTTMAAALVEYMFIVNPKDANILRTRLDDFALSTAKGILNYLGIKYKETGVVKLDILGKKVEVQGFYKSGTNYINIDGRDIPIRKVLEAIGLEVTGRGNEVVAK